LTPPIRDSRIAPLKEAVKNYGMVKLHNLGYPYIGENREWKRTIESYWKKEISAEKLLNRLALIKHGNWEKQRLAGLNLIPVGDFHLYDHILSAALTFGAIPKRIREFDLDRLSLDTYFLMAKGRANNGKSTTACEMTKWFDTNYHYIVPELDYIDEFELNPQYLLDEIKEAQAKALEVKPVIIGPISFLWLAKHQDANFNKLALLPSLQKCYQDLLTAVSELGVSCIQLDEPLLSLDLEPKWQKAFVSCYSQFSEQCSILIATYFGDVSDNLHLIRDLPLGLHLDLSHNPGLLAKADGILARNQVLSAGIVDGRGIWRCDLNKALAILEPVCHAREDELWLAPSCSLIHCPINLESETSIDPELKSWMAFADQKLLELALLRKALASPGSVKQELEANKQLMEHQKNSNWRQAREVMGRVRLVESSSFKRRSTFEKRKAIQQDVLQLPLYPTTTIGSFPQTKEIRNARKQLKNNKLSQEGYETIMKKEISSTLAKQEEIGLDLLVHGEPERNDMVEYFADKLQGFAFTDNGWVVSYGSRCVKPPVIYGDISRSKPITLGWIQYSASQTEKAVKGMLTGPVTMLKWSFARDDIPQSTIAFQLALALQEEVLDLEKAGIKAIQIDEPALREALPLKKSMQKPYLDWATKAFRVCSSLVRDETQIHTHMCYCEFNEILPAIASMDADVISIEASRSNFEILNGLSSSLYPNDIGPGIYDIHSPNVPSVKQIIESLRKTLQFIPKERLWVNPDCGLKTRNWDETLVSLQNMVEAARLLRELEPAKAGKELRNAAT